METSPEVPEVVARCGRVVGRRPVSWTTPVFGLSTAARFVVRFDDGSSAFLKAATDEQTAGWLRNEHEALSAVGGGLGPRVVAFVDGDRPLLVTEDLSHGYWPAHDHRVEWRPGDVEALLGALDALGRTAPPPALGPIADWPPARWASVLERGGLVTAGLCTAAWTGRAGPAIADADARAVLTPVRFVHGDVRSDNVVHVDGRAMLVDWSSAGLGNPRHDLVQLLPTLHLEGAPAPWDVVDAPPELTVRLGGAVADRATGAAEMPAWLAKVLLRLAAINLAWIASVLDLDPPDGLGWTDV